MREHSCRIYGIMINSDATSLSKSENVTDVVNLELRSARRRNIPLDKDYGSETDNASKKIREFRQPNNSGIKKVSKEQERIKYYSLKSFEKRKKEKEKRKMVFHGITVVYPQGR